MAAGLRTDFNKRNITGEAEETSRIEYGDTRMSSTNSLQVTPQER
jgi:hypothetical protein